MTRHLSLFLSLAFLFLSLTLAEGGPATGAGNKNREHKKKLLDKLRATLNTNEEAAGAAAEAGGEPSPDALPALESNVTPTPEKVETTEQNSSVVTTPGQDLIVVVDPASSNTSSPSHYLVSNAYVSRFRTIVKRLLEFVGLRRGKESSVSGNRNGRLIKPFIDDSDLLDDESSPSMYREEVKTTVGAMLGQKECLQKAACASGAYLKEVRGKQLIFVLLDVFSPTSWKDAVKIARRSAIFNETCDYKCLED